MVTFRAKPRRYAAVVPPDPGPEPEAPYNPATDAGLFFRMAGPATNVGGAAAQIDDTSGNARHVTFAVGQRPTITASDSTANNKATYLFGAGARGTVGGLAADWAIAHNGTALRIGIPFKPDSNATGRTGVLFDSAGSSISLVSQIGLLISYDGTREALDFTQFRGSAPMRTTIGSATSECARNAWHRIVIEIEATTFNVLLDGAKLLSGTFAGAASASAPSITPLIGGEATLGSFRGYIAEVLITTSTASGAAIDTYLATYYGLSTTRTPDRRVGYEDGTTLSALFPAIPSVYSYFTKHSSTPGAVKDVARVMNGTKLLAGRIRSNGEYATDIPQDGTIIENMPSWYELADGTPPTGAVAAGKIRKVFLFLGESGMAGFAHNYSDLPTTDGYPAADSSAWILNAEGQWVSPLFEPLNDDDLAWRLDNGANNGLPTGSYRDVEGMGPAGPCAFFVQQNLGPSYEVGIVNGGVGGTTSTQWNAANKQQVGTLLGFALIKLRIALKMPNTVFGGFVLEQGINDANTGTPLVWRTNWTAVMAYNRSTLNHPNAPLEYTYLGTKALPGAYSQQAAVRADQLAFANSLNRPVARPQDEVGVDKAEGGAYVVGGVVQDIHFGCVGNYMSGGYLATSIAGRSYP